MRILIPRNLDLSSTLNFCNFISGLQEDEQNITENEYIYDYKNMGTVEPFGMLLAGSKIRNFVDSKEHCNHADSNFKNNSYAAHMGFFQSVYLDFGNAPGEAKGNITYQPITRVNLKDIENNIGIYEYIENISQDLANVLTRQTNLNKHLTYSIRELLRNVYEHSKTEEFWYAAQYWPSKDLVEVAILDEGIGIKNSFKNNKIINVSNDEEAIRLALKPGISNTGIGKVTKDEYGNTGFGLYMISNICKYAGDFVICSGNSCLEINSTGTNVYETSFSGTVIRMRLQPSKSEKISKIKAEISKAGDQQAKEYRNLEEVSIESVDAV